jgi:hypothetical protein
MFSSTANIAMLLCFLIEPYRNLPDGVKWMSAAYIPSDKQTPIDKTFPIEYIYHSYIFSEYIHNKYNRCRHIRMR